MICRSMNKTINHAQPETVSGLLVEYTKSKHSKPETVSGLLVEYTKSKHSKPETVSGFSLLITSREALLQITLQDIDQVFCGLNLPIVREVR